VKVLVIGGGAAGTAAAWRASHTAQVTVVHDRAGATALGVGACDLQHWGAATGGPLPDEVQTLLQDLACWKVATPGALVVNSTGQPRWTRAHDLGLLDLAPLAGARVAVTDLGRLSHDARAWVATLNASAWSRDTRTTFEVVPNCVPAPDAVRTNDYDFAALHDDESQARVLGDVLSGANRGFRAWLLPPSLGVARRVRETLEQRLGVQVGECLSQPGGPAGARFEAARDALFARRGIVQVRGEVVGLTVTATGWSARWVDERGEQVLDAERVVVACGGIVSGGLRLGGPRLDSPESRGFELSLGLQVPLAVGVQRIDQVGSLHGVDFSQGGLSLLEKIGVIAVDTQIEGMSGLFAAGDVIANGVRSVLGALVSGCRAGLHASSI
jgi:glycerol-3-phosphate dehydrogenase subunit B